MKSTNVLKHLNIKNRVTRRELQILTGYTDRAVRLCIEDLRLNGIIIHADETGKGYKLASTEFEKNQTKRLFESRIESEFEIVAKMFGTDEVFAIIGRQLRINERRRKDNEMV